jgi:hypothetical protein
MLVLNYRCNAQDILSPLPPPSSEAVVEMLAFDSSLLFGSHAKTQRRQDLRWKPFRDRDDSIFAPWRLERSGREHHYYSRACQNTAGPDRIVGATIRDRHQSLSRIHTVLE